MPNPRIPLIICFLLTSLLLGCAAPTPTPAAVTQPVPEQHQRGAELFQANCASCHGDGAVGTDRGPTFLHKIYESSHHSDASFQRAVKQGVTPHHWDFGPMPPVPDVSEEDVTAITGYVRWLQSQVGIH